MRYIIAGSRTFTHYPLLDAVVTRMYLSFLFWPLITQVVSGKAPGVDTLGEEWSRKHCLSLDPAEFPAPWTHGRGKGAGIYRNTLMAQYAQRDPQGGGCILLWDGSSRGTENMLHQASSVFKLRTYLAIARPDDLSLEFRAFQNGKEL